MSEPLSHVEARAEAMSRTLLEFQREVWSCAGQPESHLFDNERPAQLSYNFQPCSPGAFLDALGVALGLFHPEECPWFLDCGCGPGITLRLAREYAHALGRWLMVQGVELQPALADFAARFSCCTVHHADLLDVCDEFYRHYQIIGWYKPLRDPLYRTWLARLASVTSPGTVLFTMQFYWPGIPGVESIYRANGTEVLVRR